MGNQNYIYEISWSNDENEVGAVEEPWHIETNQGYQVLIDFHIRI